MEQFIIAFLFGVVFASFVWVGAIRRAAKKPQGNTAKVLAVVSGGGGGPDPSTP